MQHTPDITIGLDLGDKAHAICVLDATGMILDKRMISSLRSGEFDPALPQL